MILDPCDQSDDLTKNPKYFKDQNRAAWFAFTHRGWRPPLTVHRFASHRQLVTGNPVTDSDWIFQGFQKPQTPFTAFDVFSDWYFRTNLTDSNSLFAIGSG